MTSISDLSINPYIVGNPVTGAAFYGREEVFTFVRNVLATPQQNAVILYGQRRIGKTSILKELLDRLPSEKFQPIYFDLQGWTSKSLPRLLYGLADRIAPVIDVSAADLNMWQSQQDFFSRQFLPIAQTRLAPRRLTLLLDEFDVLGYETGPGEINPGTELFLYLRQLMDEHRALAFVFVVGRRLEELPHWTLRTFKEAQLCKIGPLRPLDARALIIEPVQGRLTYTPESVEAILELTHGHAYFTQLLCYELFNLTRREGRTQLTPADVQTVAEQALQTGTPAFAWLWEGLSPAGRLLLAAVAELTQNGVVATEPMIEAMWQQHRLRPPGPDWSEALRTLVDWDILIQDTGGAYHFATRLLGYWVLKDHALSREKALISQLSRPAAEAYQTARVRHNSGDLVEAIRQYQTALRENPNYLGARLALGQVWRERQDLKAAVEELEEAFWLDPTQARPDLVKTRLVLASRLEEQGQLIEAALQLRRVRELSPDNSSVEEKLRIWYDRGLKALETGQRVEALEYLEQVERIDPHYKDIEAELAAARRPSGLLANHPRLVWRASGGIILLFLCANLLLWSDWPNVVGELIINPASMPGITPRNTPTVRLTPTRIVVVTIVQPINSPISTATPAPQPVATSTPSPTATATPAPTRTPTPTTISSPTPIIIVVTPTFTPPPPLPTYPSPQLLSPADQTEFTGRAPQPRLEWAAAGALGPEDYYVISVEFQEQGRAVFDGARTKETFWEVEPRFFDRVDASRPEFKWRVVVAHITVNEAGQEVGTDVSPFSESRTFRWTGKR